MAQPQCTSGDGNPATAIVMMLGGDGQTWNLCDECLAMWAITTAALMTGIDPAPFIAGLSEDDATTVSPEHMAAGAAGGQLADEAGDETSELTGQAAGWVESGEPPPTRAKAGGSGRTRKPPVSAPAAIGGGSGNE